MSSHPSGLRFSPFASPAAVQQQTSVGENVALRQTAAMNSGHHSQQQSDGSASGRMHGSRSMSEARNPIFSGVQKSNNSNRNSLKETNSNRSSMDMATSYNTLIIHDDSLYNSAADFGGMLGNSKKDKDRPRSFGTDQVIKEILETDDYNQSSVLKQLVKEMKLPTRLSGGGSGASGSQACQSNRDVPENDCHRPPPKYGHASGGGVEQKDRQGQVDEEVEEEEVDSDESGDQAALSKLKSKSQPDLSRIIDIDLDTIEV